MNEFLELFPSIKFKTTFIHNCVNLTDLIYYNHNNDSSMKERYILCVALHNIKKGLDTLIKAFKRVNEYDPELQLYLAGDGPLRSELERLCLNLKLQDRVKFLGSKTRKEVRKLLHGCILFVLASRYEPFGIAIIEALACKKAVIATKVGGIPEIIENGKTGLLVEPDNPADLANAIIEILLNKRLRSELANNGYNSVLKRFNQHENGRAYEKLFENFID
jgi:glycosyltransferase involved in cell wall biosynthesis